LRNRALGIALDAGPPAAALPRLLAGPSHGGLPDLRPDELIDLAEESGLTGRGGAAFPVWRKLRAVAQAGRQPVVVANGVEGEPPSRKDKLLLGRDPHLVLDGVVLAAAAIGAREAFVTVDARARSELEAVQTALRERSRRRDRVRLRVVTVPTGFVAGEETALVAWLSGKPPRPTSTPPRPFERGVGGAPTLVQNVETLAHLALVARFGPTWFRALGTPDEPGTALATLSGAVRKPGVHEIPLGLPLADLVAAAGGATEPLSAFLVGGYFGTWLPAETALRLELLDAALRPHGASLGARAIVALPGSACGLRETARIVRYLADESAGQCGPCVNGLDAIAGALERLAEPGRARPDDRARLARWLDQVRGRGACRHPDGAVRLVESALRVFATEIERHARGRCAAGR